MAKIGNVGRLITKRSRGKMATTIKNGGTSINAARGTTLLSETSPRIMSGKTSSYDRAFSKEEIKRDTKATIKRRGKTALVVKQVRKAGS